MTSNNGTHRYCSSGIEKHLSIVHKVLDKGFIRVIDYMGGDESIVQSARVSYGTGTKTLKDDKNLINYLMRHSHTSPFEMCEIKLHIKLPIFVARQWIRHRTANVNEYSARYSILDNEFYIPSEEVLASQSTVNKQGRGYKLSSQDANEVLNILKTDSITSYKNYESMLSKNNLSRELARINLPSNIYTQWYWKIDLHNLFHFLKLRADNHSQYEIRVYANKLLEIVKDWCPISFSAFENYILNSVRFSSCELSIIRKIIAGEPVNRLDFNISDREWSELHKVLLK